MNQLTSSPVTFFPVRPSGRGRRSFRLPRRLARLAVPGEAGQTSCSAIRLPALVPRLRLTSWSLQAPHEHRRLAASVTGRPFGPAPPSLRVDPCLRTEHHLLHASLTTPKPERWERALLTHGPLAGSPGAHRSPPPALCARGSPLRPQFTPLKAGPVRSDPLHDPARATGTRPPSFFCQGLVVAPSGTSPPSKYFHHAINSFRANATIPTFRARAFPAPNRR